jgi:hypothetical protein
MSKTQDQFTPTSTPGVNSTKRLSTVKTPGSPKAGIGMGLGVKGPSGGVKDVVSPGELCGFVSLLTFSQSTMYHVDMMDCNDHILPQMMRLINRSIHYYLNSKHVSTK